MNESKSHIYFVIVVVIVEGESDVVVGTERKRRTKSGRRRKCSCNTEGKINFFYSLEFTEVKKRDENECRE